MTQHELEEAIRLVARTTIERRARWDAVDSASGDGDFGSTIARGFAAVLERWEQLAHDSPRALLEAIADVLTREMGGSSGPLWGVAFERAGRAAGDSLNLGPPEFAAMLAAAVGGVRELGHAEVGDKTMLDALVPLARVVAATVDDDAPVDVLGRAAIAAVDGARATRALEARRGRAAYAGARSVGSLDAGAVGVAEIAVALSRALGGTDVDTSDLECKRADDAASVAARDNGSRPTKQFVNESDDLVAGSLRGLAAAHPDLVVWDETQGVVRRAQAPRDRQVGLISGGGSGHEPLHAGFVGRGMLTAAAPGQVFASPSVDQVLNATRSANAGAGVLHIIKNYTGDRMNFALAAELAASDGIEVAAVVVDDDVAIERSDDGVGRRGTGATVLVEKLAGARAEAGGTLDEVREVAQRAVTRSASFGIALSSCSTPGGGPVLDLGPDEIEVGVGIHGEPGRRRERMRPAAALVDEIVEPLLAELALADSARVLAFVTGLGATTLIEQQLVFGEVAERLRNAGVTLARSLVGPYLTALNMAGVLVTLLELDEELEQLWDAPVVTPGLRWGA